MPPSDLSLDDHFQSLKRAVASLDRGATAEALAAAQVVVAAMTDAHTEWQTVDITTLLAMLKKPKRAQLLARALWIISTVHESSGRLDEAKSAGLRAMELYARLRMSIEEMDFRAALELGVASRRLREA